MISLNFFHFNYDNYVYFKKLNSGDYIYLLLYMDDMLIAIINMRESKKLKEQFIMAFEMKDLEVAKKILGMKIIRDRSNWKFFLSQKEFAKKFLHQFGMKKSEGCFNSSYDVF
jgi:Reverse transcriptase (RNA-dependent DNA polymerase)